MSLAIWAMVRESKRLASTSFAISLVLLGLESLLRALSATSTLPQEMVLWGRWSLVVTAMIWPCWLVFSMSYSRGESSSGLRSWKWPIALVGTACVALAAVSDRALILGVQAPPPSHDFLLKLGPVGSLVQLLSLAAAVLALLNLERTFRASVGTIRWRIKFMMIGFGTLLAARVYFSSQSMLQGAINISQRVVHDGILLLSYFLIFRSLLRSGLKPMDIYPSHAVIRNSLTLLITGIYLLLVGVLTKTMVSVGGEFGLRFQTLAVLALLAIFAAVMLSDRMQQRFKYWVAQNFQRPQFDYRQVWTTFTQRLAACGNRTEVCRSTAKLVSETFNALSVTLFVIEETQKGLGFGASTSLPEKEAQEHLAKLSRIDVLAKQIPLLVDPVNIDADHSAWADVVRRLHPSTFNQGGGRMCLGLNAAGRPLGVMIVGDRVGGEPFSVEETDLLRCIADQVAGNLFNFELSERLLRAREMEAFQTMSTFFVHDLKNTAATLSLMLQNLPVHFDDPDFRRDAFKTIGKTVERINELITRVGMLRQKTEIRTAETDLNELVKSTVEMLQQGHQLPLEVLLGDVPHVWIDAEHIQKVLTNLLLNAKDALGPDGRIFLETSHRPGWVQFSVRDNGCGMTREFMDRSLFRPFQTTKKKGIGIGMYHSRVIVEAHRGKIDVDSEPGSGSTFRVMLPMKGESA